jgi:hypothetical protein
VQKQFIHYCKPTQFQILFFESSIEIVDAKHAKLLSNQEKINK